LVAAAACVLALAGCGSSSLSATALRDQAAQVCMTADRQAAAIPMPRSPAASVDFVTRGLAVLEPEIASLRVLRAPEDLDQAYTVSLDAFADKLGALTSAISRMRAGADPRGTIAVLAQCLAPLDSRKNGVWRRLDIPACLSR